MKLLKNIISLTIILSFSLAGTGQEEGLKSISIRRLKSDLTFIASDSLQGRRFGTDVPGLDIAADYLVKQIRNSGLKPGAPSYIQTFGIISSNPDKENTGLIIRDDKKEKIFETDSLVGFIGMGINRSFTGEIVFAGFGWIDKESGYNDFENIDVKNKIVLYSVGTPVMFLEELEGKKTRYNSRLELAKYNHVMEMGATGVILVSSPNDKKNSSFKQIKSWMDRSSYSLKSKNEENKGNCFIITLPVVYDALSTKQCDLQKTLTGIAKNNKPYSVLLKGLLADISVAYRLTEFLGKNVIGIVEGSDPELKNECVVFMAHYDHLGMSNEGDVYNGADDNGSGTVTLLEIARTFENLKIKPKRSFVFLWVTGEELGMLGSRYYTGHPVFPLENTMACINLDMVGRVFEKSDTVWRNSPKMVKNFKGLFSLSGDNCPDLVAISDEACKKIGLIPDKSLPSNFLRSSDHYSFYNKGVPILNYATGYHADYHKVTDEISKINFNKMKKVAELCFLVGYEIANQGKKLDVNHSLIH